MMRPPVLTMYSISSMRIAAQRIELEPGLLDHRTELVMRRDAHAMSLREPAADAG